jgi:pyrroloquinoline quinone biosynthesis protein E
MRIKNKKQAFCSYLKVRFLRRRVPLAVRWQLTHRCVLKCKYCNVWKTAADELRLDQIILILDEMAALGTQTISFSGGEPMLRKDIGLILEETAKRGISTEMNSTGIGIPENMDKLKYLDFLKISVDGPEETHDLVRGKNAFKAALAAARAAQANHLRFIFSTTLTKYNIKDVDYLLGLAREFRTLVAFQPLKSLYRGVKDVSSLEPEKKDYDQALQKLVEHKRRGNPHLRNSLIGLRHISSWPKYPALKCWAGRIFCILNTDGTLVPCDRIAYNVGLLNCVDAGFTKAFFSLPEARCGGCGFCGVLELNFLMSFKFGTLKSIYDVVRDDRSAASRGPDTLSHGC